MADNNDNNIIISRMQQRRGLKQDLPQPLRPGELGFAVDSRQVFIGGDPLVPNAPDYNGVSYFENTSNARGHAISIANNNLIAFTVPFVKFGRGEFNGVTKTKQWTPTDARSIVDPVAKPRCYYSSKDFTVFDPKDTFVLVAYSAASVTDSAEIYLKPLSGESSRYDIYEKDILVINSSLPDNPVITNVVKNLGTGEYTITLDRTVTIDIDQSLSVIPSTIVNFDNGNTFKSSDVYVHKNGIKLMPEANSSMLSIPSPEFDYVLDGSDTRSDGTHILTLRTIPQPDDEVTVCYYGEESIIQALEGVYRSSAGKSFISPVSDIESFYTRFSIPEYRKLNHDNIYISKNSGLGFIGLEHKHIVIVAEGEPIPNVNSLSLGRFQIHRADERFDILSAELFSEPNGMASNVVITVNERDVDLNIFTPLLDEGEYRYNKAFLTATDGEISSLYICDKLLDVLEVTDTELRLDIPVYDFTYKANISARLNVVAGNGYTDDPSSIKTEIVLSGDPGIFEGVSTDDWIRVFSSGVELNDIVFKVQDGPGPFFDTVIVNVDDSPNVAISFTNEIIDSVQFVNHGPSLDNISNVIQVYAQEHGFVKTDSLTGIKATVDDVSSVHITEDSQGRYGIDDAYDIIITSPDTFFIDFAAAGLPTGRDMLMSGKFRPEVNFTTGTAIKLSPVLTVDLSTKTSLKQVVTVLSKTLVPTKENGIPEVILPLVDYVPTTNNLNNAIYVTQDPAYSSVSAGGIDFFLHEDRESRTLGALGLNGAFGPFVPRKYNRDSTVKAKLEEWLDDLAGTRETNLITNVFLGGAPYANKLYDSASQNLISPNSNIAGTYNLIIDDNYGEVIFCTREEASAVNRIINTAYSQSIYDRSRDFLDGTQGLLNLKNNLELQTRESAVLGEPILTYPNTNVVFIPISFPSDTELFVLGGDVFNAFFIDYTISDDGSNDNKYSRVGQMKIVARPDFVQNNQVVLTDDFNSRWELPQSTSPLVEPQFYAEIDTNGDLIFKLRSQFRDYDNPILNDKVIHTLGTSLVMKYVVRRWNSTIY